MRRKSLRNPLGPKAGLIHPIRRVPALSTAEAADVVLKRIMAEQSAGFSLDQIDWQGYCRDGAVLQLVSQELTEGQCHIREMAS